MQSPGRDPGYKVPGGVEGLSQASTDSIQGESPAAQPPLTARSCQRPVTFLSVWSILGFLGREWQLTADRGGSQIPEGPAGGLWTTQGELGRQVREIHTSTTKEAEGLHAWDLALRFPLGHPGPM